MNVLKSATRAQRIAALVTIVAVVAAVIIYLVTREETYRTIAIEELSGTTLVSTEGKEASNAYEGMHLYSGDDVSVQKESDMTMVLDMDKYVYAEPETHFWLECAGSADDSRTVIRMDAGSILNRIKNNLNEGEIYQVDTPNSTMAVRGTVFRVTVYKGEDGLVYTLVEVLDGKVQVDLKTETGEYNGISELFGAGEAALIRGNSDFSEFVVSEEGSVKHSIDYKDIPQNTAIKLVEYIDDAEELCIGKELLQDYAELAEHRLETREGKAPTCTEDGYEEVWCSVCNEVTETVTIPALGHTVGDWQIVAEPTCVEAGKQQKVCSVCGEVCEETEIEALGHTQGTMQVLSVADCTHGGTQIAYCTTCNAQVASIVTDALGHTPGAATVVSQASCTSNGISQVTCSVCGEVLETTTIGATGHNMGDWKTVKSSTCTENGKKERECSWCGYTESESTSKGGHNMVVDEQNSCPATCGTEGVQIRKCSVCGHEESTTIVATGEHDTSAHTDDSIHSLSDERDKFIVEYFCSTCDQEVTISVPAKHTIETSPNGNWNVYTCSCNHAEYIE